MNKLIYYGSSTLIPNYNCSNHFPHPSDKNDHLYSGVVDIIYGFIVTLLYIPSLVVFYKQSRLACFKIMFLLGITDIGAIFVNSICTGIFLIQNATYCDYPNTIYISGVIGLGCWCSACLTCLILALNRILDMVSPLMVKIYFRGYRTYFVLIAPIIYGVFFAFFTPPIIFSAKHGAWFFDPLVMKNKTMEYANIPHTINNFTIVVLTFLLYVFFCFKVRSQFRKSFRLKRSARQRKIFIQSTLLCVIHLSASVIYVIMQFVEVPNWITISAQYLWQLAQGCPVIIYLLFNHKVRGALFLLFTSSSQDKSSYGIALSNQVKRSEEQTPINIITTIKQ